MPPGLAPIQRPSVRAATRRWCSGARLHAVRGRLQRSPCRPCAAASTRRAPCALLRAKAFGRFARRAKRHSTAPVGRPASESVEVLRQTAPIRRALPIAATSRCAGGLPSRCLGGLSESDECVRAWPWSAGPWRSNRRPRTPAHAHAAAAGRAPVLHCRCAGRLRACWTGWRRRCFGRLRQPAAIGVWPRKRPAPP